MTALQQLIEFIDFSLNGFDNHGSKDSEFNKGAVENLRVIKEQATELLETERQVIVNAWQEGYYAESDNEPNDCYGYYDKTFGEEATPQPTIPQPNELFETQLQNHELTIENKALKQSDWLSPIKSERTNQIKKLKQIIPGYPDSYPNWQVLNTLLHLALQAMEPGKTQDVEALADEWADKKFKKDSDEWHNISEKILWLNRRDNFEVGYNASKTPPNERDKYDQNAFNPM